MEYEVSLEFFEGPFDLLLELIRKNKFDITELSLARITDEYLSMLESAEHINLDEIAEFLKVATTLLYIKSKRLTPNQNTQTLPDDLEISPQEIIEKLKLKKLLSEKVLWIKDRMKETRTVFQKIGGFVLTDSTSENGREEPTISSQTMLKFIWRLNIIRRHSHPHKTIRKKKVDVEKLSEEIIKVVSSRKKTTYRNIVEGKNLLEKAVAFFVLMELARLQKVTLFQEKVFDDIRIEVGRNYAGTN